MLQRRVRTGRGGMVTADVMLAATVVIFLVVVLAFGWWRARQAEPPPKTELPYGPVAAIHVGQAAAC